MNSIREIEQTVAALFSTLHTANFPNIPLNWSNSITVDLENLEGTFVLAEIHIPSRSQIYGMGGLDYMANGELVVATLRALRKGFVGFSSYSDMLMLNICNRNLSGITYLSLSKVNVSPYPGIVGQSNTIPFIV